MGRLRERMVLRRKILSGAVASYLALLAPMVAGARPSPARGDPGEGDTNVVVHWNNAALQAVRDSKLGPPMVARALAILHTCMFDAWAAYSSAGVGTQLGISFRRPAHERSLEN